MSFLMPIQWYHSHVDPIWQDGTFKEPKNRVQGASPHKLFKYSSTGSTKRSWRDEN
jgi:hypothetical protein